MKEIKKALVMNLAQDYLNKECKRTFLSKCKHEWKAQDCKIDYSAGYMFSICIVNCICTKCNKKRKIKYY